MSRKQIYDKYFNSNIFNNDPALAAKIPKVRTRISQSSLLKTKDDLFNTENPTQKSPLTKKGVKRLGVYSKLYGSDIFNKTNPNLTQKKSGVKKIRNANNFSSCFDSMKNLEEYKNNLKSYTKEKRTEKKNFKPDDKYINNETPAERYYKEMYEHNGTNILPERCFSADKCTKEKYATKKKNMKNEENKLNDEISELKLKPKINKKIYVKKKNKWTEDNSGNYHFIDNKKNPVNNARINKQIYLQSNLFKNEDVSEKKKMKTLEQINNRIEEEKSRIQRNNRYHFSPQEKRRDLSGNDRMIYGSVHSKWEKSKIDWLNPQTEIMFGTQQSKDLKKEFGPKGPNAFQRKLNQLADSKNIDTINENQKEPINKIIKPQAQEITNDQGNAKWNEVVEKIPNLSPDKKLKIKQNATNSVLNDENNFENKAKTLTNFYTNPNMTSITKKPKKEVTDKIGKKKNMNNSNKKPEKKSEHDFTDYVLTYATKGNFEKFGENEIKNLFEKNGVHIYDIHKNMFDKGTYNMVKFKVRDDKEGQDALNQKITNIEKDLGKNYRVKINKEKKKNLKINSKNFVSNPGAKLGILNENIGVHNNAKYTKIPDNIKNKKSFSRQFEQINYGYKKNK
jgi:hypothetical protein